MRNTSWALFGMALVVLGASAAAQQQNAPAAAGVPDSLEWAYTPPLPAGSPPPPTALPADDNAVMKVPGNDKTMPRSRFRGLGEIPDWWPEDHRAAMPNIVRSGREKNGDAGMAVTATAVVRPCGLCHLADGSGRPENAPVSSLHPTYFIQQMEDFKNGLRNSADPRKANTKAMAGFAKNITPEELKAAADYFAAQPYPKRVKIVESKTAPKVRLQGGMHMPVVGAGAGMEPIGDKIVEVPDDNLRAELRDTRLAWTVYVPPGTINRGQQVAAKYQCNVCHGSKLEGIGPVPPLAGRSPSYTMRQLYDMKVGARRGPWAELMKPLVDRMSQQEMSAVAAFAASIAPPAGGAARGTR